MLPRVHRQEEATPKKAPSRFLGFPWKLLVAALVPVALLVYYVTRVAPSLLPVPEGTQLPFPLATAILENVCAWCGQHQLLALLMGAAILSGGFVFRLSSARYYICVAVLTSLVLAFTYYSISAPIDRLLKAVKDSVPQERKLPSYK